MHQKLQCFRKKRHETIIIYVKTMVWQSLFDFRIISFVIICKNKKQGWTIMNKEILLNAIRDSFIKLNPKYMIKNPVMFVVEVGLLITLYLTFFPNTFSEHDKNIQLYNAIVSGILFITVLFANFAEAVAEGRGKAQAESLKKTKKDTKAKLLDKTGNIKIVNAGEVKKGDIVLVETGDIIPKLELLL